MKKRIYQILFILCIALLLCHFMTVPCQASWVLQNPEAVNPGNPTLPTEAKEKAGNLLGVLQVIGSLLSIMILIILGIRYMTGSAIEKAEYKKNMVPYVIGAIIVFTGTILPKVIFDVVNAIH